MINAGLRSEFCNSLQLLTAFYRKNNYETEQVLYNSI